MLSGGVASLNHRLMTETPPGSNTSIIPTDPNHPGVARFVIKTCECAILKLPTEDVASLNLSLAMRSIAGDAGQHTVITIVDRLPIIALILERPAATAILATDGEFPSAAFLTAWPYRVPASSLCVLPNHERIRGASTDSPLCVSCARRAWSSCVLLWSVCLCLP